MGGEGIMIWKEKWEENVKIGGLGAIFVVLYEFLHIFALNNAWRCVMRLRRQVVLT